MTDVRRKTIPLLWSTVGETALAKGFCSNLGDMKYQCVCRRTKLPGKDVHSEVREICMTNSVLEIPKVVLQLLEWWVTHCACNCYT